MNTATRKTGISMFLAAGLFALAGVFANGLPASAQTQEPCPLPMGVTAIQPPPVTAQQVAGGTGSLMQFALAATERFRDVSEAMDLKRFLHYSCLLRQEGSPWRSGSTYVAALSLDGRVYFHAKDMSLSGRRLDFVIFRQILASLGVSPTDLANLASTDPVVARQAYAAVSATLLQEPDGPFDATATSPGASGHAGSYVSTAFGGMRIPFVALAGFDLNESHLFPLDAEQIDHGDPATTAADVVNRATLKAFVEEAGKFIISHRQSTDPDASAKAFIALRDPAGPWRHGSVYLYVLDRTTNTIVFHGAEPDRFELRPLTPTVRDAVTGEYVLPQVIAAATGSPDGGFVDYYWDDPADDSDRADIPKVGYAREFTAQVPAPDGTLVPFDIIVGSGFYGTAPEAVAEGGDAVIETVLPQVMRAMTASTVDAVSGRIEQAISGTPPAATLSFGGATTLSDAILANGQALGNGTLDLSRLLAGSSFTMPLNAADNNGGGGLFGNLTFWGSGDYRSIAGGNPQSVDYDGSVVSANLGIDTKMGADMLAGVSVSQTRGTVDYSDSNADTGELTTSLTSVNPYVGWQMAGGMNLWAMAGYGSGEVEMDDEAAGTQASDLTQSMVAAGVSGPLMSSDEMIGGGTTTLNLKGEVAFTSTDIDGSGTLASMSLSASRQRLVIEGEHVQKLDSGATFTPSLELGLRNDGGDGETGTGIEAGGALRYTDAGSGLTVEGRVRTLLNHSGDHEEIGVSGLVRIAPGASGQGLALSVEPALGQTASGVQQLWENGVTAGASPDNQARLNAEIGYGLRTARGLGLLTPYTGLGLSGDGARSWRMGARWQLVPAASLSVEGTRHEGVFDDGPAHGLMLRGAVRW